MSPIRLHRRQLLRFSALTAMLWQAGDSHEHLGQLVTYARSVGVTPPWSK